MTIREVSKRESEIINLVSQGYTYQEIADRLYLSIHTVKTHVKNIHRKMECRNTAHMITKAFQSQIIQIGEVTIESQAI